MASAFAGPSWWSDRGAVKSSLETNEHAVVNQGQLKQFTVKAVQELNEHLTGGAGNDLNTLVQDWAQDYQTHGYSGLNPKPEDFQAMTAGQLKFIGNKVWAQLVSAGYVGSAPSWLAVNSASDSQLAVVGQLKSIFDFDLGPYIVRITSPEVLVAAPGSSITYAITATGSPTSFSASSLPGGLSLNTSTGVITGTAPSTERPYSIHISASNGICTGSTNVVLNVLTGATAPVINSPSAATTTVGANFLYQITASHSPTLFGATGLPTGLSINTSTGVISGTASVAGTSSVSLSAQNAQGTGTGALSLVVKPVPGNAGVPPSLGNGTVTYIPVSIPYSFTYQASGSPKPTFSLISGSLPPGLSFSTTGVISGTPTTVGTYQGAVSASNGIGYPATQNFNIVVQPAQVAASITSQPPPAAAVVGTVYRFVYQTTGSPAPLFNVTSGNLPPGLSLSLAGVLSGTPTTAGTYTGRVSASNGVGSTVTQNFSITVQSAASSLTAMFNFEPSGVATPGGNWNTLTNWVNGSIANAKNFATGGTTGIGLQVTSTFTYSTNYGTASTVLYPSPVQTYAFAIASGSSTAAITLSGLNPSSTYNITAFGSVAGGSAGTAASYSIGGTIISMPLANNISTTVNFNNVVPDGTGHIVLSITGGPGTIGDLCALGISLAGTAGQTPTITNGPPTATSATGGLYGFTYQATGSPAPTFSVSSGSLPPGLSLSPGGVISGTTTTAGTYTGTVKATNGVGGAIFQNFSITVQTIPSSFTAMFNFEPTGVATPGGNWNTVTNWTTGSIANAKDISSGSGTGIGLAITTPFTYGSNYGTASTALYPSPVQTYAFAIASGPYTAAITLSGLNPTSTYNLTAFGSQNGASGSAATYYTIGGTLLSLPLANPTTTVHFTNVVPDSTGHIVLSVAGSPASLGDLSALGISLSTNGGQAPAITNGPALSPATIGLGYNFVYTTTGAPMPTFSLSSGSLPPGLSLSSGGVISGNPTNLGTYTGAVTAANGVGSAATQSFSIAVQPTPSDLIVKFNFEPSSAATPGGNWNTLTNWTSGSISNAKNFATGSATGIGLQVTTAFAFGSSYGTPSTALYPSPIQANSFAVGHGAASGVVTLSGLDSNRVYSVTVFGSDTGGYGSLYHSTYTIGTTVNYQNTNNTTATAVFSSVTPDSTGHIALSVNAATDHIGSLGALIVSLVSPAAQAPGITYGLATASAAGMTGQNFVYMVAAGNGPVTFAADGLPAGLSINTATGIISGTPTAAGIFNVVISATNAGGTSNLLLTLNIAAATPAITSPLTVTTVAGAAFSYPITANYGPMTFTATGPLVLGVPSALPAGLSVNSSSGIISGTASTTGTYSILLQATNAAGQLSPRVTMTLTVVASTSIVPIITSSSTATAIEGSYFSYAILAQNGPTSYGTSSALPSWLHLDTTHGILSGTASTSGTSTVGLTASNANGANTIPFTLTIITSAAGTIQAPVITSPSIAYATVGQPVSYTATATNGPVTFSATGLPSGLTMSSSGAITGTPTSSQVGTPNVTIAANNAATTASGHPTTAPLLLVIQSDTSTTTDTLILQSGISPFSTYQAASATILTDTSNSTIADMALGTLNTGRLTSTQTGRSLLVFDLSVLPPTATITTVSLILHAEPTNSGTSAATYTLGLYSSPITYTSLSQLSAATWNNSSQPTTSSLSATTPLSTLALAVPTTTSISGTWTSTSSFVSAARTAYDTSNPLSLMLASPSIEGTSAIIFFNFDGSRTLPASGTSLPPALLLTYTTSAPPIISNNSPVIAIPGSVFSYQIAAINVNGSTTYAASGLPSGLTMSSSGLISGTAPSSINSYPITVTATNGSFVGTSNFIIDVGAAPVITSSGTLHATVNSAISNYQITATNTSNTTATYSATNLPAGLSLNSATGVISGTPTEGGNPVTVTLGVKTPYGTGSADLLITYTPVFNTPPISGNLGVPFSYTIPTNDYTIGFSISSTDTATLASYGLALMPGGSIAGTNATYSPTATTSGTGISVTITGTNEAGINYSNLNITILGTPVPTATIPLFTRVEGDSFYLSPYQYNVTYSPSLGTNSYLSLTYSLASGSSLPPGLTMDGSGTISGSFTAGTGSLNGQSYTTHLTVSDGIGSDGTGTLHFLIYTGPGFLNGLSDYATVNKLYTYPLQTLTHNETSTYVTFPSGLNGLSYDPLSKSISGIPTTPGAFSITLGAANTQGTSSTTLNLVVEAVVTGTAGQALTPYSVTTYDSSSGFSAPTGLPPGLSLSSSGTITGTPQAADVVPATITFNSGSTPHTTPLLFMISPNPGDLNLSFQDSSSPTSDYTAPSATIVSDSHDSTQQFLTPDTGSVMPVGLALGTGGLASKVERGLLAFDLSDLPPHATITSAKLVLNGLSANSSGSIPVHVEIHQAASAFDETTANWQTNNAYQSPVLASLSIDPSSADGAHTFIGAATFTSAVQQAYQGTNQIYLELLAPLAEGETAADYIGFSNRAVDATQNPKLVITYTLSSPQTPIITSPATVTGTVGSSLSYQITANNAPLSYSATANPSGSLPGWLSSFNTTTGLLQGTPTAVGSTSIIVGAANTAGTATKVVTLNVDSVTRASSLAYVSGNAQVGEPGTFTALPLVVEAFSGGGTPTPLPTTLVTFTVPPGQGFLAATNTGTPALSSTLSVVTDSSGTPGYARAYLFYPPTAQTVLVTATAGAASPVNFIETSSPNATGTNASTLAILSVVSGNNQSAPAFQVLGYPGSAKPVVIKATNALGQPIAKSLSLTVTTGGGSISTDNSTYGSTASITTNADTGLASIYWKPGLGGGITGIDNKVKCSTSNASDIYLSATTQPAPTAPTPGGGTAPTVDLDPQSWNGSAWIIETDEDNVTTNPTDPDPTRMTLHWSNATAGVTGFLVEKKISTGQWFTLATPGTGTTKWPDTGLQANEEVQYRVHPYIKGILGAPTAPVIYQVPLIKKLSQQTSHILAQKTGFTEFADISSPPKYYLTETLSRSGFYNIPSTMFTNGGQTTANGVVTYTPVPDPEHGLLQFDYNDVGNWQEIDWIHGNQSNYDSYTFLYANEIVPGGWGGEIYTNVNNNGSWSSFAGQSPWGLSGFDLTSATSTTEIWDSFYGTYYPGSVYFDEDIFVLSNEYKTETFINDADASMPDYGSWQDRFSWYNDGQNYGIASRILSPTEDSYGVTASTYKFTAYSAKNINFQWAEVFVASDDPNDPSPVEERTTILDTHNWTINSYSSSESSVFEVNPLLYSSQFGNYYLTAIPQITVPDGSSHLDKEEKTQVGAQVSQVPTGTSIASYLAANGGDTFTVTANNIPGTTYAMTWSGASTLQIWGYNYEAEAWQQIQYNEDLSIDNSHFSAQFVVIGTQQAQDNDSITVTLTSKAPDDTTLGTDSSKFYYSHLQDFSIPFDEASGARYRKIALNGLPMPDEKPQQSGETDQEKEETYVDALTDSLHHSTTDIYLPISGSDMSLSARRDTRSQVWSIRNGLRPHEQPDLPFGPCWSSNLAPNIHFVVNSDPKRTSPDQAIVTDETGAVHSFVIWYEPSGNKHFFPLPTAKNEQQVPNLESLTADTSSTPPTYIFTRKFGTTLRYQGVAIGTGGALSIANDRTIGSQYGTANSYARLIQATDRLGNTINYQFLNAASLVPTTITSANQPDAKLYIQQTPISSLPGSTSSSTQSVITAIWDANWNKTTFGYTALNTITGTKADADAYVLTSVTTPDNAVTRYTYSAQSEADLTPHAPTDPGNVYWYTDVASISDPLGHTYSFVYTLDHSKLNYMSNPDVYTGYFTQSGGPRNLSQVTLPDGSSKATFDNSKSLVWLENGTGGNLVVGPKCLRQLTVTDATNFTRTYQFSIPDSQIFPVPNIPGPAGFGTTYSKVIAYPTLDIGYGNGNNYGSEEFKFEPNAAMALSSIRDLSGNLTTFNCISTANQWTATGDYAAFKTLTGVALTGYYNDPVSQTDALGHTKYFTYDVATPYHTAMRIMTDVTDENGNVTHYDIDSFGRRTSEKISDSGSHLLQETDFAYGNSTHPGFMTQKTVKALGGSDPGWTKSLITQYVPDKNGRIAQEIVDPSGLNLVTIYAYDANGNKISATDPLGHTTWFSYDSHNRLVTVTFADGGQRQMVYDLRGNKITDYDENGIATFYVYDRLNRLVSQTRDMNASGTTDSPDLTTSYTYNAVNSKLTVTDPVGGVTKMDYDGLQRVIKTTDALNHTTLFQYGTNSGGNAFDSTSFKPTQTTDPRGIVVTTDYDALYRPISKKVKYDPTAPASTTSTVYDPVGNVKKTVDPLGNPTTTSYDALNRPLVTTYADLSTTQQAYTSTGFKYQVTDQNGNITKTQFDRAARVTFVLQPQVNDGSPSIQGTPTTATSYDAAGNVVEMTNPIGSKWHYAYDARNRKVQEFQPAVLDKESDSGSYNTTVQPTLTWVYDQGGRTIATIDARGSETDTVYDAANRVTDVTGPLVPVAGSSDAHPHVHTTYDKNGNVLTVQDPNGHTTTNTYDLLNRLTTTTDAASNTVTYAYDEVGNRTSVTDGNSHVTQLAYDGLDRNTLVTDAANVTTQFKYNALNKTQRIDSLNQTTTYYYDVRNRLQYVIYDSPNTAVNPAKTYSYDNLNLRYVTESGKDGAADVAYTYDALNRISTETSGGKQHTYYYDLAGNRVQTIYGGTSRTITSIYDALSRLSSMTEDSHTSTYAYDLNGNIVQRTLQNGDVEYDTYDRLNRAKTQNALNGSSVVLYGFAYGYDLAGNVATIGETYSVSPATGDRIVTNTYDNINRLHVEDIAVTGGTGSTNTTYSYDGANNRTAKILSGTGITTGTTAYSYNNLNQLTSTVLGTTTNSYTYDANGNRTTHTVTISGSPDKTATDTYTYDFENRLVGVAKNTPGIVGTYAYTYDYRSRRVVRDERGISGTITHVVFSGGTSVQEYDGTTPTLSVEYIRGSDYGGGVGGILYTIREGNLNYTHENKRGDIIAKTNSSGSRTFLAKYEAFGKHNDTGSTTDRQKANSKDEDPTGLLNEGMRYRDLDTGTFLTRDPAGFVDGPNLYTYVVQNPWSHFDPEGLTMEDLHQFWVGMGNGFINIGKGVAQTVLHPVTAAEGIANAALHPVNTALAVKDAAVKTWNSGPEGKGEVMANVLAAFVPGGAEANVGSKVAETAEVANAVSRVSKLDEVGAAINDAAKIAGNEAKPMETAATGEAKSEALCNTNNGCFVAGTPVLESGGEVPIESVHVGDRVLSRDARHQESSTTVDPTTWKDVKLIVEDAKDSRHLLTVEALRSPLWLQLTGARPGAKVWFEDEDIGIQGWAAVQSVDPCPPIHPGTGRVVLTTYTHLNHDLFQLQVAGLKQSLEVTGLHRIYSATRQDWVHARNLRAGELLQTYIGTRAVTGLTPEPSAQVVYNFEVETDHTYFVSDAQVLVHNACGGRKGSPEVRAQNQEIGEANEAAGTGSHTGGGDLAETYFPPPEGGRSGGRYADVTNTDKNGLRHITQTVDTDAHGIPTAREVEAALDIHERLKPGEILKMVPKAKK